MYFFHSIIFFRGAIWWAITAARWRRRFNLFTKLSYRLFMFFLKIISFARLFMVIFIYRILSGFILEHDSIELLFHFKAYLFLYFLFRFIYYFLFFVFYCFLNYRIKLFFNFFSLLNLYQMLFGFLIFFF